MMKCCLAIFFMIGVLSLTACGSEEKKEDTSPAVPDIQTQAEMTTAEMSTEVAELTTETGTRADAAKEPNTAVGETAADARELTQKEISQFEVFLNKNYGFLLSEYETPKGLNLDEVFYCAGGGSISEAEKNAYLKATGAAEIETDMGCLSTAEIDKFLIEKTGVPYKEMKNQLSWTYLPEYDSYYNEHGDTNIQQFICENGSVEGDIYKIRCISDVYTRLRYECVVTLKKADTQFQFVANQVEWDDAEFIKQGADQISMDGMRLVAKDYREKNGKTGYGYEEPLFDSDRRYYTEDELNQLKWNRKMAAAYRNEIYARHGYIFSSDFWNEFFGGYTWYQGTETSKTFDPGCFNEYEKANLKIAVKLEQ